MDVVELEEKVNDEEEGRRVKCVVGENEEEDEERGQDVKQPEKKRNTRKRKTSSTAQFDLSQSPQPPSSSSSSSSFATVAKRAERAAEKEWDAMYTYCRLVTTTHRVAPHHTALHCTVLYPFRSTRLLEFISLLPKPRTSLHIKSLYTPPHHETSHPIAPHPIAPHPIPSHHLHCTSGRQDDSEGQSGGSEGFHQRPVSQNYAHLPQVRTAKYSTVKYSTAPLPFSSHLFCSPFLISSYLFSSLFLSSYLIHCQGGWCWTELDQCLRCYSAGPLVEPEHRRPSHRQVRTVLESTSSARELDRHIVQ